MKRFALFILLTLLLASCNKTYSWKHKLVITVETPTGVVSGSAVQAQYSKKFTPNTPWLLRANEWSVQGEAAVVDLGDGRYLFALLKGEKHTGDLKSILQSTAAPKMGAHTLEALSLAAALPIGTVLVVPEYARPMLVTFGDLSDPASVMRVDPADLAATFGAGFALREITLEITDDAVTDGVVEGVLGWVLNWSTQLDGDRYHRAAAQNRLANDLNRSDFLRLMK